LAEIASGDFGRHHSVDRGQKTWLLPAALRQFGVDDGTRTHDGRDHNPGLYQLSYVHRPSPQISGWRARQDSNLRPSA
jgi:hypothetical protein